MDLEYIRPTPTPPAIKAAMMKAVQLREEGVDVVDFSSGNVGNLLFETPVFEELEIKLKDDLPIPLKIISEGMRKGILDSFAKIPRALGYSPTTGTPQQKRLVIRYMKEIHKVPLSDEDTDRVACTAGGQQAMAASLRAIKPGTNVFMLQWDYSPIPSIVSDNGCNLIRVKMSDDFSLDKEDLNMKLTKNSVFYLSMPNNPTGYTSVTDFKAIVETISDYRGGVIWDAPYLFTILELSPRESPTKARFNEKLAEKIRSNFSGIVHEHYEHLCILSSLSKTCLIAGLRFGFVTASKQWISNVETIIARENLSAPTLSFITGTEILQAFLAKLTAHTWMCDVLAKRICILLEEDIPLILPRNGLYGALYALVRTPTSGENFAAKLLNKGIVTIPGSSFSASSVNAVRLSLVAVPWTENDEKWVESVRALKKAL